MRVSAARAEMLLRARARSSTVEQSLLHPWRETENVSRLTELKQRVGHSREGCPRHVSSLPFALFFHPRFLLRPPPRSCLPALSRDISSANTRSRTVKGLTSQHDSLPPSSSGACNEQSS